MVQTLTHRLDVFRIQAGGHRLNTLPFTGQQQSLAVVLQRLLPVLMSRGCCQALHICRETSLLRAWHGEACSHENNSTSECSFCDPFLRPSSTSSYSADCVNDRWRVSGELGGLDPATL